MDGFDRVMHIDFLGPVSEKMIFILIDAYFKSPKVCEMSRKDTVFDNGLQFVSSEFREFF